MKRFFLKIVVGVIAIILFSLNSYAADETGGDTTQWTDLTKSKVDVIQKDNVGRWDYYIKVTGITLNEKSTYKIYIKSGDVQPDPSKDKEDQLLINVGSEIKLHALNEAYRFNKDVYCFIIEQNKNGQYGTPYKTKLERCPQHNLGSRIKSNFSSQYTAIYCYDDNATATTNRKVKVKIGNITDKSILLSIKNGEAKALERLLDYAKSASSIYTETISLGESKSITSGLNITNGSYYYVYMIMEDENGKYYPIEDVSLYQALIGDTIGKNLYDYLDNLFEWNLEDTPSNTQKPTTDTTTPNTTKTPDTTLATGKIPKAGLGFGLIILIILTIGGLIFAYYKNNRLKGI